MISRDIEVVDFYPEHWNNLIRGPFDASDAKPDPMLILVHEKNMVIHAVLGGRPLPEIRGKRVGSLPALRRRYAARRVICLEQGLIRRAMNRGESQLSYDMDYVEQILTLVRAFREERGDGLRVDPPTPPGPVPPFAWVQFLFDRLWPNDTSTALYVIDEENKELFTSLILRKRHGDIDLFTTDLHLGLAGLSAANWRVDRLRLIGSLTNRVAPCFMACFVTLKAWKIWLGAPLGSAPFKRLQQNEELVIEPYPRRLSVLTAAVRTAARLLKRRG
jgi:hypothetical protein